MLSPLPISGLFISTEAFQLLSPLPIAGSFSSTEAFRLLSPLPILGSFSSTEAFRLLSPLPIPSSFSSLPFAGLFLGHGARGGLGAEEVVELLGLNGVAQHVGQLLQRGARHGKHVVKLAENVAVVLGRDTRHAQHHILCE